MIIISKFKDYYDFMVEKYGRDDKIILDRRIIENNVVELNEHEDISFRFINPNVSSYQKNYNNQICFKFLVICGKIYIVKGLFCKAEESNVQWDIFSLFTFKDLEDEKISKEFIELVYSKDFGYFEKMKFKRKGYKDYNDLKNFFNNDKNNFMIGVSKKIKRAIFMVDVIYRDEKSLRVYYKTPVLEKIKGISGILPPEKIYQDLSYFIGNILTDQKEIYETSNKTKIVKAGFDLKTSFRNM